MGVRMTCWVRVHLRISPNTFLFLKTHSWNSHFRSHPHPRRHTHRSPPHLRSTTLHQLLETRDAQSGEEPWSIYITTGIPQNSCWRSVWRVYRNLTVFIHAILSLSLSLSLSLLYMQFSYLCFSGKNPNFCTFTSI